jgi:hypothetical protein
LSNRLVAHLVPTVVAAACVLMTAATTIWAAGPMYAPMRDEFGWPAALVVGAAAASLAMSGLCLRMGVCASQRAGVRTIATVTALLSALALLLVLPNLTHLWQLWLASIVVGVSRGGALAALWLQLRTGLGRNTALGAVCVFIAAGAASVPWVNQAVMRTSWREGTAECAAVLLLLVAPLAYVLLPGKRVAACGVRQPHPDCEQVERDGTQ